MEISARKNRKLPLLLYFMLLLLLVFMLVVHAFRIYPLDPGFFTRYLIALVFVAMLLPLVPKIKIFDIVDIRREARMFRVRKK